MKMLVLALFLSVGATAQAHNGSATDGTTFTIAGPTVASLFTTYCLGNQNCEPKLILVRAQEDAATFVGSNGKTRGAQLEQALLLMRDSNPGMTATDMDLANQILAETN